MGRDEMAVRRFRLLYVLAVVMRVMPLVAKTIWPTRGELASNETPGFLTAKCANYTKQGGKYMNMMNRPVYHLPQKVSIVRTDTCHDICTFAFHLE